MTPPTASLARRRLLAGIGAGLCACRHQIAWAQDKTPTKQKKAALLQKISDRGGCALHAGELDEIEAAAGASLNFGDKTAIPSSGDPTLDRALGAALVRMSQTFEERPGFAFYDDSAAPNALATTDTRVEGTWGTVLLGKTLFWSLVKKHDDGGVAVIAMIAHEFGHVVQFRRGLRAKLLEGQATVKRMELHADFLSGYYLGVRKRETPTISLLSSGAQFRAIGDRQVDSRNHHGTPDERIASAERGFKLGVAGERLQTAIDQGQRYVMTL